jgi:CHAD domain-containing protein
MPFKLKRRETVTEAVSRLGQSCARKALAEKNDDVESIHNARKQIKKMLAVLRLVRKDIGEKEYGRRIDGLREAAHLLAPPRDAYIRFQTFEDVCRRASVAERKRVGRLRSELRNRCNVAVANFSEEERWDEVRKSLEREAKCFSAVRVKHDGWAALAPGLKKSYRAAQKERKVTAAETTPPNLHRWRKRVKDLLYNISLLEPLWPEQMCALKREIGTLAELLGDHHDLHVLRQAAVKKSVNVEFVEEVHILLPLLDARQKELSTQSLKLGESLLREKPSDFCSRLHRYWTAWSRKKGFGSRKRQEVRLAGT